MTTVWIDTDDMKFIGYYCMSCDLIILPEEGLGSMFFPICPNCRQDAIILYDIEEESYQFAGDKSG